MSARGQRGTNNFFYLPFVMKRDGRGKANKQQKNLKQKLLKGHFIITKIKIFFSVRVSLCSSSLACRCSFSIIFYFALCVWARVCLCVFLCYIILPFSTLFCAIYETQCIFLFWTFAAQIHDVAKIFKFFLVVRPSCVFWSYDKYNNIITIYVLREKNGKK